MKCRDRSDNCPGILDCAFDGLSRDEQTSRMAARPTMGPRRLENIISPLLCDVNEVITGEAAAAITRHNQQVGYDLSEETFMTGRLFRHDDV